MTMATSKCGTSDASETESTNTGAAQPSESVSRFRTASGRDLRDRWTTFAKDAEKALSRRTSSRSSGGDHQSKTDGISACDVRPRPTFDDLLAPDTGLLVEADGYRGADRGRV